MKLDFLHIPHVATYYSDLLGLISHTKEVIRCVGRPFFRCLCHEIDGTTLARSMCIEIIFCVLCHLWQIRYSNILHDIIQHFGCFIFGLHFYKIFHKLVPGFATWQIALAAQQWYPYQYLDVISKMQIWKGE